MRRTSGFFVRSLCLLLTVLLLATGQNVCANDDGDDGDDGIVQSKKSDYIRWVDFKVPCYAMQKAIALDIETHGKEMPLHWIELLACLAAHNGNNWSGYKDQQLDNLSRELLSGKSMAELTKNLTYYGYYLEAYSAVLSGFVGDYEIEVPDGSGGKHWEMRYGLKVFSPIAKSFPYNDCDDFGAARSYGWSRVHLGHDMMGAVGTPIIAVEGGVVEALGWNEFGGWRIGIRSHDKKRYYYYAHLRRNYPYQQTLKQGDVVKSGDVIGYMGRTGYSKEENVNNIETSHLHFGMELIFDESQKDCVSEIWIDTYQITRLLENKRSDVRKNPETQDYERIYDIRT